MFYSALVRYLRAPEFNHAIDAVPFILHGGPLARRWSRADRVPIDHAAFNSIFWSLKRWTAFLGAGPRSHHQMRMRLSAVLPSALEPLVKAMGRRVVSLGSTDANLLEQIRIAAVKVSKHVKGSVSPVLGSKVLHLLLPALVPAYDNAIIRVTVLPSLSSRGRSLSYYLGACRTVLCTLARAPERRGLDRARRAVWRHLRRGYLRGLQDYEGCYGPWYVEPPEHLDTPLLVDSYVAEYVLIGLSRLPRSRSRQIFATAQAALDAE